MTFNKTVRIHSLLTSKSSRKSCSVAMENFNRFVTSAKTAFSHAVDGVFLVAACLMAAALVIVFLLPEIPLRRSARPTMEEAGIMLEDELGNADDDCQPRMQVASDKK